MVHFYSQMFIGSRLSHRYYVYADAMVGPSIKGCNPLKALQKRLRSLTSWVSALCSRPCLSWSRAYLYVLTSSFILLKCHRYSLVKAPQRWQGVGVKNFYRYSTLVVIQPLLAVNAKTLTDLASLHLIRPLAQQHTNFHQNSYKREGHLCWAASRHGSFSQVPSYSLCLTSVDQVPPCTSSASPSS